LLSLIKSQAGENKFLNKIEVTRNLNAIKLNRRSKNA